MRRVLSLLLLLALTVPQAPIACLNGGAHAADPAGGAAAHLSHAGDHEVGARHAHGHGSTAAPVADIAADADEDSAGPGRPDRELSCTALARCHWAALPEPASELLPLRERVAAPQHHLNDRPAGLLTADPTPPPRALS
jgi:hypothetical protein